MAFTRIILDVADGIATLTLNDPRVFNAMGEAMLDEIVAALDIVEDESSGVRALLITGAGKAFCAGANLQERGDGRARPVGMVLESHYHPILRRLRRLPCPIVTAVNGAAAGGGMSFAMIGDLVIAARSAYFLQAFRRIGLVPDVGATWLLPRRVGIARAMELSLLGERLPAETALEWGLINRVADDADLMDEARALAIQLAHGPTRSLALTRDLYWDSFEQTYEQQLDAEFFAQRRAGKTADHHEGVAAFREKRQAQFSGA